MSATDQGVALAFHDQSQFSFGAMARGGLEYGVVKFAGGKTGFGQKMSSAFGKLGEPIGEEAVVGVIMTTATIATGLQLTEMAIGLRKQFDINAVIEQSLTAGLGAKLSSWETPAEGHVTAMQRFMQNSYIDKTIRVASHGAISSAVYGTPLDMGDMVSEYIGDIAQDEGKQLDDKLKKKSQPEQQSHRQAQGASQGNQGMLDSPYRKNVLSTASQKTTAAASGKTAWGYGESFEDSVKGAVLQQWGQEVLGNSASMATKPSLWNEMRFAFHHPELTLKAMWTGIQMGAVQESAHITTMEQGLYHHPEAGLIGFGKAAYNTTVNGLELAAGVMEDYVLPSYMLPGSSALFARPQIPLMQITGNQVYGEQAFQYASLGAAAVSGLGALADQASLEGTAALAGMGRFGLFGDTAGLGAESVAATSGDLNAANHINALRLQQQLGIEEREPLFAPSGKLSQGAIQNARQIPLKISNTQVKEALSKRPGNLADWGKYETTPMHTNAGLARMHFYHNPVTDDVYYGMDYKAVFDHQGLWNLDLTPSFDYEPPRFNPQY